MQHVVHDDYLHNNLKLKIKRFNHSVEDQLSDQNFTIHDQNGFESQGKPNDDAPTTIWEEDHGNMNLPKTPEVDDVDDSLMDKYLNAELIFGHW